MDTYIHIPTGQRVVIVGTYGDTSLRLVSTRLNSAPHFQNPRDCFDADTSDLVKE